MKFLSHRLLPFVIVAWTIALSVMRAIRLPNDFSEAHWLLDYRFSFMKRGLIGSLCSVTTSMLGFPMTPRIIGILSALTFCSLCAALLFLLFRALRQHVGDEGTQLMALVFASSPFLVMSAHLFGYFDALLYVLTIASVALTLSDRPFTATLVSVVAMLSYESYLLIGFPLVCLASFLRCSSEDGRANWARHTAAQCVPLLVFIAIVAFQSLVVDKLMLRQQLTQYLGSFPFIVTRSEEIAIFQTTSFFEFLHQQDETFWERVLNPVVFTSVVPSFFAILYFIHSSFRVRPFGFLSVGLIVAIGCPLAMHAIAWDTVRISTYVIGGVFITAWILGEVKHHQVSDGLFMLIALTALVLNVFGSIPLMDGEEERFSNSTRAFLYAPALLLALSIVTKRVSNFLASIRTNEIPNKSMESDE